MEVHKSPPVTLQSCLSLPQSDSNAFFRRSSRGGVDIMGGHKYLVAGDAKVVPEWKMKKLCDRRLTISA